MVDTIGITIEDIHGEHAFAFDNLLAQVGGWSKEMGEVELGDILQKPSKVRYDFFKNHITNELKPVLYGKPINIQSNNYKFICVVDPKRNELTMTFSLPKYIYGTNVYQFILNPYHPRFQYNQAKSWDYQIRKIYPHIMYFIKAFLDQHFISHLKFNFEKIAITRIDLCFNQVFHTKDEKETYLQTQRLKRKKGLQDDSSVTHYDGSVFFKVEGYSTKIYDKGKEFRSRKGDRKKLLKLVRQKKMSERKFKLISQLADRTLRYELTYRSKKMTYLYTKEVFRRRSSTHQKGKELYQSMINQLARHKAGTDKDLGSGEMAWFKYFRAVMEDRRRFYLKVDPFFEEINTITPERDVVSDLRVAPFYTDYNKTSEFCEALGWYFKAFFDEYQLEKMPLLAEVMEAEKKYDKEALEFNRELKEQRDEGIITKEQYKEMRRPRYSSMFKMYMMLRLQLMDDAEILQQYPQIRSSLFRYRRHFTEDLGFSENSFLEYDITPPKDFGHYYSLLLYDYAEIMH